MAAAECAVWSINQYALAQLKGSCRIDGIEALNSPVNPRYPGVPLMGPRILCETYHNRTKLFSNLLSRTVAPSPLIERPGVAKLRALWPKNSAAGRG